MIGLALVTFVAVLASGLESSTKDDLTRQVTSDYVVVPDTSASAAYFDGATGPALASAPGVTSVSAVRSDNARVLGSTVSVNGIDGATIAGVYRFAWKDGSDAVLADLGNGAIVDSKWAKTHKLSVGSPLQVQSVERHQARRSSSVPPTTRSSSGLQRDPGRSLALRPDVPEPAERLRVRERRLGREPVDDRRAREVAPAVQRRDRPEHVWLDQDAIERHQDDTRPSSTRSSRSP